MSDGPWVNVTIQLEPELIEKIAQLSGEFGLSPNQFVVNMLERAVLDYSDSETDT